MKIGNARYWRIGRWQVEWHPDGKDRWKPLMVRLGRRVPQERGWTAFGERLIVVRIPLMPRPDREDHT